MKGHYKCFKKVVFELQLHTSSASKDIGYGMCSKNGNLASRLKWLYIATLKTIRLTCRKLKLGQM